MKKLILVALLLAGVAEAQYYPPGGGIIANACGAGTYAVSIAADGTLTCAAAGPGATAVTATAVIGANAMVLGDDGARGVKASTLTGVPYLSAGVPAAATAANVVSLWTACSGYLKSDGTCATVARNLSGTGILAKCQGGVPGVSVSLPAAAFPSGACESDGIQAYIAFTANTAQTMYDRFDLPTDWTGVLKLTVSAYSTSQNAPTVNVYLSCIGTGAVASPTFGSAQAISITPLAASGRTAVTTTLTTDATYANKACASGDMVEWKLIVTAAAAADLRMLSVRFTE